MKESSGKGALKKPALILGLSFVALGCTLGFSSLAWFSAPRTNASVSGISGEAIGSYFSSVTDDNIADGTKEHPFGIQNAKQLYYFAWLQDMGFFNKDGDGDGTVDTQYYFELMNDIDASNYILPPCGIEKFPFLGNFDAKNYTISNLTISNALSTADGDGYIKNHPLSDSTTSSTSGLTKSDFEAQAGIVGFFGIIGEWSGKSSGYTTLKYSSNINKVKNLYLDNITIKTKKDNLLVGIFAGYANGVIDNCGVHYAKLSVEGETSNIASFGKVSNFTLVGAYNNVNYSYSQDSGGSGTDYGTSTDIRDMYEKLKVHDSYMSGTTMTIPETTAIPFNFDNSSSIVAGSGSKTISSSGNSITASYASTLPVASSGSNLGYYSGGNVEVYEDYFDSSKVNFDNMKTAGNSKVLVDDDAEHIDKIKAFLKTEIASSSSRIGDTAMMLSDTYFGDGNRATSFPSSDDNYLVVKDAKVGTWSGDLFIPARGIWVAPTKAGRFEFVGINTKSDGFLTNASISVFRLKRSTPKDYSTGFSNTTYWQGDDFTDDSGNDNDMCGCTIYGKANAYVPYYFGVDVSDDDINKGYEFFITKYPSAIANPYIVYIDVGTSGNEGTTTKADLGDFDFVTKNGDSLTKIKTYDESAGEYVSNSSFTKSDVTFVIGNTTGDTTTLAFRRLNDTVGVYYYQSATVLTPSTSGAKTPSTKEDCTSAS